VSLATTPRKKRRRGPDDGLRPLFRQNLREGFFWTTVETGFVTQGVPDSNYLADGVEGWIEYKATRTGYVKFRPEQVGWHLRRRRYGGISWIAVRWRRDDNSQDDLVMFQGADVESVMESGARSNRAVLRASGGPARWPWLAVRRLLVNP
jgi:hypothetical protein